MPTEYIPKKSHMKALRFAIPPGVALVLVWCAHEFLHREIPADVALEILAGVAYGAEWARNKIKHGISR